MTDILEWKAGHDIRYREEITGLVVADVLELAAKIVVKRGWCQARLEAEDGRVCAVGAIYAALGGPVTARRDSWARQVVSRTVDALVGRVPQIEEYQSVSYWNDTDDPGADGVAAVFNQVAATLRREDQDAAGVVG